MAEQKLFQDQRTGKLVEFVSKHDKEFAMVKDAAGNVTFMTLEQLVPYDKDKGRLAKIKAPELIVPESNRRKQLFLSKTLVSISILHLLSRLQSVCLV